MNVKITYKILVIIFVILGVSACKKKDNSPAPTTPSSNNTTNNPTSDVITVNSDPQTSYVLDGGTKKSYVSNDTTINSGSSRGGTVNAPNRDYNYSSSIDDGNGITYLNITIGTLSFSGTYPSNSTFKAFFPVGNMSYSINAANGVEITVIDANAVLWSSSLGGANQTGSTFSIDETKDNDQGYGYYLKVKASFSCKLYDGNGNVKVLTSGIYVGDFGNI